MKTYTKSSVFFTINMVCGAILLCPTLGLWGIVMLFQWLNYTNNVMVLGKDSVIIKTGILSKHTSEIRYTKINSVSVSKKWWIDVGDIVIFAGNDLTGIGFSGLDNPFQVKAEIDKMIEQSSK